MQNFITPKKKSNNEMYAKHWASQERVRKEIKLASGISNTSQFDYNLMIKLIGFKLHYGNHATEEEVEARKEAKPTVKDIECVDTIARIQVPEDSAIIDASDALQGQTLEKEIDDFEKLTEAQKEKELFIF